jgi:hypothetical protein
MLRTLKLTFFTKVFSHGKQQSSNWHNMYTYTRMESSWPDLLQYVCDAAQGATGCMASFRTASGRAS